MTMIIQIVTQLHFINIARLRNIHDIAFSPLMGFEIEESPFPNLFTQLSLALIIFNILLPFYPLRSWTFSAPKALS
jgi:hypothetical protein